MRKPYLVVWSTGCRSNFSTLEKAEERIDAGLNRTDGDMQRGGAEVFLKLDFSRPRKILIKEPAK